MEDRDQITIGLDRSEFASGFTFVRLSRAEAFHGLRVHWHIVLTWIVTTHLERQICSGKIDASLYAVISYYILREIRRPVGPSSLL